MKPRRSKERLEKLYWYICQRWYEPRSSWGRVMNEARMKVNDLLDEYGGGLDFPSKEKYKFFRDDRL